MKAVNFNPNQLPSWPATFCVCNIILAISSTILVTHSLVLNKANKNCLENLVEGEDCTGVIPSCTLEKALLTAQGFLFCYSIFIGFNSVFWMIFSCCKSHNRKQGFEAEEVDHSILHLVLHSLGSVLAVISGISLLVLALHAHFLIPTTEFKNKLVHNYFENGKFREFDTLNVCLGIFDNTAWNVLSLVCLSICFIGHVSLIVYLFMKRSLNKKPVDSSEANSDRVPTLTFNELLPTLHQEENSPHNGRLRIPSARNYPSSPITLNPFSLSPAQEEKPISPW